MSVTIVKPTPEQQHKMCEPCPGCGAFKKYIDKTSGKWYCAWCGFEEGEMYIGGSIMYRGGGIPY